MITLGKIFPRSGKLGNAQHQAARAGACARGSQPRPPAFQLALLGRSSCPQPATHSPLATGTHPGDWQFAPGEGAVWGRPWRAAWHSLPHSGPAPRWGASGCAGSPSQPQVPEPCAQSCRGHSLSRVLIGRCLLFPSLLLAC